MVEEYPRRRRPPSLLQLALAGWIGLAALFSLVALGVRLAIDVISH